jgi:hypothetical protein
MDELIHWPPLSFFAAISTHFPLISRVNTPAVGRLRCVTTCAAAVSSFGSAPYAGNRGAFFERNHF